MAQMTRLLAAAAVLGMFVYVLWLSNDSNRQALTTIRETNSRLRYGQYKQQELLNRLEYRLAKTSTQYGQLLQSPLGGDLALALESGTPYQSNLQKASAALKEADTQTALDVLTKTNHELLDKLKSLEDKSTTNSSAARKVKAKIVEEVGWPFFSRLGGWLATAPAAHVCLLFFGVV
jgi:hypothetical protein